MIYHFEFIQENSGALKDQLASHTSTQCESQDSNSAGVNKHMDRVATQNSVSHGMMNKGIMCKGSVYCLFFTAKMPVFNKTQTTLILYYLLMTTLQLLSLPLSIFSVPATSKTLNDPHSKFYP